MPLYEYRCLDCRVRELRVAALDDHTALCMECAGVMLRLDEDVFRPYFEPGEVAPATTPVILRQAAFLHNSSE